ncbi:MAG: MgtC/SapB family protein [Deltaproteobacteria bacterium]
MLTDTLVMIRLFLSVALGGLVGLEREVHGRAAGLRTHMMVSLGSCLIMLTSMYVFDIYKQSAPVDPSRIAAGVITGIGFLGAGTILRGGNSAEGVRGLTTASSLWVVAAIGLAVGTGFYAAAIFTTVLALVVLLFLGRFEKKVLTSKG